MAYVSTMTPAAGRDVPTMLRRVGQPYMLWAFEHIMSALGSPIVYESEFLLPAERPPDADHWEEGYQTLLRPWRRSSAPD